MKKRLVSLALAVVMLALAMPTLALPLFAVVEKEGAMVKETFNLATDYSLDCTTNSKDTSILKLYTWYFANGTPVRGESNAPQTMTGDCYARYNEELVKQGVFSLSDDYETILSKYADYLKSKANVVVAGNWELGTLLEDGRYWQMEKRLIAATQSIYGVRMNMSAQYIVEDIWYEGNPRITSKEVAHAFIDAMIIKALGAVQVGDDGVILLSEIMGAPLAESYLKSGTAGNGQIYAVEVWHDGSSYFWNGRMGGFMLDGTADPNDGKGGAAYVYNVPEKVDGKIKLSFDNIYFPVPSQATGNALVITKNGEVIFPADAVLNDFDTYYKITGPAAAADIAADELAKLNAALAELDVSATTGDQIAFVFQRINGTRSRLQASPSVEYEERVLVEYQDQNGNRLVSYTVAAGDAMPKAPYRPDEAGFLIDGVAGELPATVTADTVIQYAGGYDITPVSVEKASIAVSSNFAVNLFVKADDYAKRAGLATTEGEYWGVAQADGTFKITIPGYAAKNLMDEQSVYLFQEFNVEEYSIKDNDGAYTFTPADILAAYATSDASDGEKAVAAAALDYAAAAKAYFYGEALDATVEARLAAQDAAIAAIESDVKYKDREDFCVNGMKLVLRDQVTLKVRVVSSMYMELNEDVLDYSVVVTAKGEELSYTGFEFVEEDQGYSVVMLLGGIAAADFDVAYEIVVKNADGESVSEAFKYSVNDYIARCFDANADDANIIRAIYALGVAANNA